MTWADDVELRLSYHRRWRQEQKESVRAANRKQALKKYGLTVDDYNDRLQAQMGVCAICEQSCSTGRVLAVDHNHDTGKVRGLLCSRCNQGIGQLKCITNLKRAIDYLERNDG